MDELVGEWMRFILWHPLYVTTEKKLASLLSCDPTTVLGGGQSQDI